MKIAFITCIGSVDDTRTNSLIRTLSEAGHKIVAITAPPRSSAWSQNRITYIALPRISRHFWHNSNILNICAATLMRVRNFMIALWATFRERPEVCLCHEPDSWLIGVLLKLFTGASVTVVIREIYEERSLAFPRWLRSVVYILIRTAMRTLSKMTDCVIHVSEARRMHYSYLSAPSVVISYYPCLEEFGQEECPRTPELHGKFVAVHAGALRLSYAARELLLALERASLEVDNLLLLVLGGVAGPTSTYAHLLEKLQQEGKILVLPVIPHKDVIRYLKMSDVGISLVVPVDKIHQLAFPRKLFEYMAAGLPVIGCNVPDIERVVKQEHCGLIADASSPDSIARAIVTLAKNDKLRQQMAENARRGAERYQGTTEASKLMRLYSDIENVRQQGGK